MNVPRCFHKFACWKGLNIGREGGKVPRLEMRPAERPRQNTGEMKKCRG